MLPTLYILIRLLVADFSAQQTAPLSPSLSDTHTYRDESLHDFSKNSHLDAS